MNPEEQKLNKLLNQTRRTLFSVSSVFPFTFFIDTIRIDENKIDIIYQNNFFHHHVFSILLPNINGVTVTTGMFFASISLEVTGYEKNPDDVHFLPKQDALKARRIILGLIAADKEGIDLSKIPVENLTSQVEEIGRSRQ